MTDGRLGGDSVVCTRKACGPPEGQQNAPASWSTGWLLSANYETREGDKRTSPELAVDDIGASLKFATVKVDHAKRTNGDADRPGDNDAPPF